MYYTIIYLEKVKRYDSSGKSVIEKFEETPLLIAEPRKTLFATIKAMKAEGIKIVEVYRTNKNGINTNIKF